MSRDPGFEVVEHVLTRDEVEALRSVVSDPSLSRTRAGARHLLAQPLIGDLARQDRLTRIASRFVGASARPFRATLFDKSPSTNWLVTWHQDTVLPLRDRNDVPGWGPWTVKRGVLHAVAPAEALMRIVALRVHVDDSTAENGPLRVLPGTHVSGVLSRAAIVEVARRVESVECTVASGGVVAMRPLLVHASSKSLLQAPRRVLHVEYADTTRMGQGLELEIA